MLLLCRVYQYSFLGRRSSRAEAKRARNQCKAPCGLVLFVPRFEENGFDLAGSSGLTDLDFGHALLGVGVVGRAEDEVEQAEGRDIPCRGHVRLSGLTV